MKRFIKILLDPIRLFVGAWIYILFNKNTNLGYQGMVSSFCNTHGVSSKILHEIIKKFNRQYSLKYPINGVVNLLNKSQIEKIAKEIQQKGYYVFAQRLSDKTCDELLKFALETEAYVRPVKDYDNSVSAVKKLDKQIINRKNPISIRYDFMPEQLIQNEEVQKLLADLSLIAIAQEYLQCKPKSDVLGMWWHTAFSKEENADAATMYHFDMDRVKWLKFFFYLTDTTKESGAHQFIEGSHNGNIPRQFLKKGYARLKDSDVTNYYGKEKEITYEAPRGTIIAEDTSGLHRGNPVQEGDRLLFQIQFSDSLFGGNVHKFTFNGIKVHRELQNMMKTYPDTYELYRS
ncbi:MAG: phytanoyl-CoA dioxygenase family protein [Sulfuricurvum sp.]|nr:phytanoyl-CoA dioxygenase family protein [Sulfuricurvum sp.]MDP3023107.1 phytanoyl-CoA dioxygenase family protein [Sulfuricurvum sp.]